MNVVKSFFKKIYNFFKHGRFNNGEPVGEDTAESQALIHEWRFGGMFLADDERFVHEPDRLQLEQAALKILKFALTRI